MKIAIFSSGNGGNFQAIVDAVHRQELTADIAFLCCDNAKAKVIQRAKQAEIPVHVFSPKESPSKEAYEETILYWLKKAEVELLVLAGYMRIVGPTLLSAYPTRIINIHPSLLPEFPGRAGIKEAFDAKVLVTGVTIHFVDAGIDSGPIIAQETIPITRQETLDSLEAKIHHIEHTLYPQVLARLIEKMMGDSSHDKQESVD